MVLDYWPWCPGMYRFQHPKRVNEMRLNFAKSRVPFYVVWWIKDNALETMKSWWKHNMVVSTVSVDGLAGSVEQLKSFVIGDNASYISIHGCWWSGDTIIRHKHMILMKLFSNYPVPPDMDTVEIVEYIQHPIILWGVGISHIDDTRNHILKLTLLLGSIPTIFPSQLKYDKNFIFLSHPNFNKAIATKFCTWHDSCAVVAFANFCCNMTTMNGIAAN